MSDCGASFSSSLSNVNAACISAEQFAQGLEIFASTAVQRLKLFLVELDEVRFDGKIFQLNSPIFVTVYVEDGVWYCENTDFSSLSFGATAEEAVHSFCEDFAVLWDEIANTPAETLTSDALRVRQALLSVVKRIEKGEARCR